MRRGVSRAPVGAARQVWTVVAKHVSTRRFGQSPSCGRGCAILNAFLPSCGRLGSLLQNTPTMPYPLSSRSYPSHSDEMRSASFRPRTVVAEHPCPNAIWQVLSMYSDEMQSTGCRPPVRKAPSWKHCDGSRRPSLSMFSRGDAPCALHGNTSMQIPVRILAESVASLSPRRQHGLAEGFYTPPVEQLRWEWPRTGG